MSCGVEIVDVTEITLPPPSPPPPPVRLSFFDTFWILIPPVQKLILYSKPIAAGLSYSSLVQALKSSLSTTLLDFLPLLGKLIYIPTTGDVEIDLSDPSVTFVEAESDLDLHQLAGTEIHDVKSFMKLVPDIDVTVFPFRALAVQVTRFGCGGVAIGYAVHHGVVDGKGMVEFIEAWASACRAKLSGVELLLSRRGCRSLYDRSVIQHPRGDEISREFLQSLSPNLPITGVPSIATIKESRLVNSRRTFVLDAASIQSLKQRGTESKPPSTFVALSAYIWACYVRTKSFDPNSETIFGIPMDCRLRLNPPLKDYFANCLCPVLATMSVSELIGEDGFVRACTAIRKSIESTSKDPFSGGENWIKIISGLMASERGFNVSASPRFRVYETDFGWGKPIRFESVSMNRDGEFALVGGKGEGSVQVSVVVNPDQLETFEKLFLDGLNA